MSYNTPHITAHTHSSNPSSELCAERREDSILLDRRYRVSRDIEHAGDEQRFPAYHVELDTPVCIITLRPHSAASTTGRAAYLRESSASPFWRQALLAANLRHPVLPRVRDAFLQGDTYYVVTDDAMHPFGLEHTPPSWHPVETLAERLERNGRLSLREALIFGLHLCDALAYLEQVAPALLPLTTIAPRQLILPQPNAIIIGDLHPARWLYATGRDCAGVDLPYCAPEVAGGGEQDARADIYSIAAVMYHMLAGVPPIPPTTSDERLTLAEIEPLIPAALSDVIELALQPDPDVRFTDANAFGRALADALTKLLPALVVRINAPYTDAYEQTEARKESSMSKAAPLLRPCGVRDSQQALQCAETATPTPRYRSNEPFVRRRPPKREKRTPLEAISAALGLQPKPHPR
jgi:serine/threonine protein kinase